MSEAEPRCFNPVAGIHYKETFNDQSVLPLQGCFNPVAGIHYKETGIQVIDRLLEDGFQSRCRDSL